MSAPVTQALGRTFPALYVKHEEVLELVLKLDRVDSGSYVFRYPADVGRGASLPNSFLVKVFVIAEQVDVALTCFADICRMLDRVAPSRAQLRLTLVPALEPNGL
jgi:hypothetical protein